MEMLRGCRVTNRLESRWFEAGERRLDGVEFVAFAKALKVDPIELFTLFVRAT